MELFVFSALVALASGAGMITHTEVAHRAMQYYAREIPARGDLRQVMLKNQDAFQAGAVYPDTFYAEKCNGRQDSLVSDRTHWVDTFLQPALEYFNERYPGSWEDSSREDAPAAQKLLAFLLGVASHSAAESKWLSIEDRESFVQQMASMNFGGDYKAARKVAETGSDSVNMFTSNFAYIHAANDWYVPTDDLVEIYQRTGVNIGKARIEVCSTLMFAARFVDKMSLAFLYVTYAMKSPLLAYNMEDYHKGGMSAMTRATMETWDAFAATLEGQKCGHVDGVASTWRCGDRKLMSPKKIFSKFQNETLPLNITTGDVENVVTTAELRGTRLTLKRKPVKSVVQEAKEVTINMLKRDDDYYTYKSRGTYSQVGKTLYTVDLNGDGHEDLVVGVPGYSRDNQFHAGRIYVIYGAVDGSGIPSADLELNSEANITLEAPEGAIDFGATVVALDLNNDGFIDLAVGAPASRGDTGAVYLFWGTPDGLSQNSGMIITCEYFSCGFGHFLTTSENNLIVGSPYAYIGGTQVGLVNVIPVNPTYSGVAELSNTHNSVTAVHGHTPYSWFGAAVTTFTGCNLVIGAPGYSFHGAGCGKLQSAGRVFCYRQGAEEDLITIYTGTHEFEMAGSVLATGSPWPTGGFLNPYSGHTVLAIGSPSEDHDAKIFKVIPYRLRGAGAVHLFVNDTETIVKELSVAKKLPAALPISRPLQPMQGDRLFAQFGRSILFADVNQDGLDDLIVGAPLRSPDLTNILFGEARGEVYIHYGAKDFPKPQDCLNSNINPCGRDSADAVFEIGENKAQFGTSLALIKSEQLTQLVIGAPRSDVYGRQTGQLLLFNNCL